MAAPRKLPATIHRRRDTYRADRYGGVEPKVQKSNMPYGMSKRFKAIWRTLSKLLDENELIANLDGLALRLLCESSDIYTRVTEYIQRDDVVLAAETLSGQPR